MYYEKKKNIYIYFEKYVSELSTWISDQKKSFQSKNNSTTGKSRKKSIDICRETQHAIMSELTERIAHQKCALRAHRPASDGRSHIY